MMTLKARIAPLAMLAALLWAGCPSQPVDKPADKPSTYSYGNDYGSAYDAVEIKFLDDAASNTAPDNKVVQVLFQDLDGKEHPVGEFTHDKSNHVVLVVTRGNTNPICPYCTKQTAELIRRYAQIKDKTAEVLLIYPVAQVADGANLQAFLAKTREQLDNAPQQPPFPVLLDMELKGVSQLGIRRDLSKPATYIIDRGGQVRYAYVGEHLADRPSVDAVLKELDKINAPAP